MFQRFGIFFVGMVFQQGHIAEIIALTEQVRDVFLPVVVEAERFYLAAFHVIKELRVLAFAVNGLAFWS